MRIRIFMPLILLLFFCHKDAMIQQGYWELKKFEWDVIESENRIQVNFWLSDSPIPTITTLILHVRVDGINLENYYQNPMVIIDNDPSSIRQGAKCINESWIPAITISKEQIEEIRVYIK